MKTAPLDTLKQLPGIGCKYVEHAGYGNRKFYGYEPVEFKKILDGLGLKMISGHSSLGPEHWNAAKNDY